VLSALLFTKGVTQGIRSRDALFSRIFGNVFERSKHGGIHGSSKPGFVAPIRLWAGRNRVGLVPSGLAKQFFDFEENLPSERQYSVCLRMFVEQDVNEAGCSALEQVSAAGR
jgi:hypothetical protein